MDKEYTIKSLTQTNSGHMLHHNSVFSADGKWIVYDGRNDDTKIGETATIGVVNVNSGEEITIYSTSNPSIYGPGVGAASFSPNEDVVVFIHGLLDANKDKPYDITRRFALAVAIAKPNIGIQMDARAVHAPYNAGSLRGGTHSHCWSPDGSMLSFTYNDELVDPDLRNVGVMVPLTSPMVVPKGQGNYNGTMYSAILTQVVRNPKWGSDEISKAFDECWIGNNAKEIAFQGIVRNDKGESITEIFTVAVDPELILKDVTAVGVKGALPQVPKGIQQKRLSFSEKGLSDFRHWLRASPDGQYIYALAKDESNNNQIVQCAVSEGKLKYLTTFPFSISSPININAQGDKITFIANNNVYLFDINKGTNTKLTNYSADDFKVVGAPVFSPLGDIIAFNKFCNIDNNTNVQIKLIYL